LSLRGPEEAEKQPAPFSADPFSADGFIGSHLTEALAEEDAKVKALSSL
jgi:hypothetical protein